MIEIYLDESGTHQGSKVITVGAAWATPDEWARWSVAWNLSKHPVKVFHSTECHNFKGEFSGWDKAERDNYVIRLLSVIRNHEIGGRIAGYQRQAFTQALASHPTVLRWVEDPYLIAFLFALHRTWEHLESQGHREFYFVHEVNDYQEAIIDYFDIHRRRHPKCFATLAFATKQQRVQLQCADILAYEGNHQLRHEDRPLRKPLQAIATGTRFAFVKYNAQESRDMARHLIESFHSRL